MALELKVALAALFIIVHSVAHTKGWYYRFPRVDMLTHFIGGLVVGAFIKDFEIAIALIVVWEFIEMVLVSQRSSQFKEDPLNKLSDVFFGFVGFVFGFEFF